MNMAKLHNTKLPSNSILDKLFSYSDGKLIRKVTVSSKGLKGSEAGNTRSDGYKRINIEGKEFKVHRLVYKLFNPIFDETLYIDHINGDRGDNRIENLRLVTRQENNFNYTKAKGYTEVTGKFKVRIGINNCTFHVGTFNSKEEAKLAYKEAKDSFHRIG